MEGLSQRKTNKTLPRLITVSIPSQGSEEACTFVRVIMVSIFLYEFYQLVILVLLIDQIIKVIMSFS
jgi:hypothetical protein